MRCLKLLLYRTVLLLRGLGFQRRDAGEVPPEELLRIDIARSVALGISLVDVIEGATWQSQALIRALRGGEPLRIALTMAWEAVHSASQGRTAAGRTARLIQSADRLAQEVGHPHAIGMATLSAGCVEFLGGRFPPALELLDRAATILREQCAGVVWELDTAHIFGLWTLFSMGRQSELRRRFQLLNEEARQRGDRYLAATTGTRIESLAWLADDNVGEARARADEAVQHWSRQRFHLQHLNQLCAHLDIDLYAGDGAAGWRRLCAVAAGARGDRSCCVSNSCASISSIPVAAVRWRRRPSPTTLGQCSAPPKATLASSIDSGCRGRRPTRSRPGPAPRWSAATLSTLGGN